MKVEILKCFFELIRREMVVFSKVIVGKYIDSGIMLITGVLVFSYFMGEFGLSKNYGAFILVGSIASFGFFEVVNRVADLIQDLNGDRVICNFLILPLPSTLVFCSIAVGWAISSSLITIFLFPLGKLILFNRFDLSNMSLWRFFLMFFTFNIFYGFFALWIASLVKHMRDLGWLWCRIINPLYMFGCYFFLWSATYAMSPLIGYLHLLNPIVYVMEGARAAILGQEGYLPFYLCEGVLVFLIFIFGWHGIKRLKERLNCI